MSFKKFTKSWRDVGDKMTLGIAPKVRRTFHLRGKNWQSALKLFRASGINSAGSYGSSDIHGPTGSIVGRY